MVDKNKIVSSKTIKFTDTMMIIGGFLTYLCLQTLSWTLSNLSQDIKWLNYLFSFLLITVPIVITLILTLIRPIKVWRWIITTSFGCLSCELIFFLFLTV